MNTENDRAAAELTRADVERALRSIRPASYRIVQDEAGLAVVLGIPATVSVSGRRNVADRLVAALRGAGIRVAASDPVGELVEFSPLRLG